MLQKYYRQLDGEPSIINMIKRTQVLEFGHFLFNSGRCSEVYFAKDRLLLDSRNLATVAASLAEQVRAHVSVDDFDGFIGAAHYGVPIAAVAAVHHYEQCGRSKRVFSAEKGPNGFFIRPNCAQAIQGQRLIILEDVLITALTVFEIFKLVERHGGKVVGSISIINRRPRTQGLLTLLPFASWLVTADLPDWKRPCHLCRAGIPYSMDFGHAQELVRSGAIPLALSA